MLTLYFAPGASSMAPHIALFEIGAEFEGGAVSFKNDENKSPAYLAINPLGQVPTLVIEDRPLTEVAAFLFYLAKHFPNAALLPDSDEGQAQVISWMSFIAAIVHPARRQGLDHARRIYALADQRLGPRDRTVGERYSIADIHLFRLFWRFFNSLNPPAEEFPNLIRLHDQVLRRPAVQRTLKVEAAAGYELP